MEIFRIDKERFDKTKNEIKPLKLALFSIIFPMQ